MEVYTQTFLKSLITTYCKCCHKTTGGPVITDFVQTNVKISDVLKKWEFFYKDKK